MLNQSLNNKAIKTALNLRLNNKEGAQAIVDSFHKALANLSQELVEETNTTQIYRTQGKILALQEITQLFETPTDFKDLINE